MSLHVKKKNGKSSEDGRLNAEVKNGVNDVRSQQKPSRPKPTATVKKAPLRSSPRQKESSQARLVSTSRPTNSGQSSDLHRNEKEESGNESSSSSSSSSEESDRSSDEDYNESQKGKKKNGKGKEKEKEKGKEKGKGKTKANDKSIKEEKSSLILPNRLESSENDIGSFANKMKELAETIKKQSYMNDDFDFDISDEKEKVIPKRAHDLTHCPFCDEVLPINKSSSLKKVMQFSLDEYHRRGGPLDWETSFECCHRHREESKAIPLGEKRGWPKDYKKHKLSSRLKKDDELLENLSKRIQEPETSPFYQTLMGRRAESGRSMENSVLQMASLDELQAGYYGERGWVDIRSSLKELFEEDPNSKYVNISTIRSNSNCPFSTNDFIDKVLLPEVVCTFILKDEIERREKYIGNPTRRASMRFEEMSKEEREEMLNTNVTMEEAMKIRNESNTYGILMFPCEDINNKVGDSLFEQGHVRKSSVSKVSERTRAPPMSSSPQGKRKYSNEKDRIKNQQLSSDRPINVPSAQVNGKNRSVRPKTSEEVVPTLSPNRPRPRPSQSNLSQAFKVDVGNDIAADSTAIDEDMFFSQRIPNQYAGKIISCIVPPSSAPSMYGEQSPHINSQSSTDLTRLTGSSQIVEDEKLFSSQPDDDIFEKGEKMKQRRKR